MPTLKIDGVEITVPPGTNLVEAAKVAGKDIPIFCYHSHLSIAANCRMCLVHGSQNGRPWPKAMPACQTLVADNMEIDTCSEKTQAVRKGVLEFILINHPLDCPVCDKSGECMLQDNFFEHSNRPSRFHEYKEQKLKTYDIGPQIIYDGERCINCTRCVRFMDEIALDNQLAQINRGDRSVIACAEGKQLDHPYAMNTVDLCPVGALLGKDFRFQKRAWFLQHTDSVCPGCARGCNVVIDSARLENEVYRIKPRDNAAVNGPWMCDDGRWTYHQARERRLTQATVRQDGEHKAVAVDVALRQAATLVRLHLGKPTLAVAVSPHLTSEDLYLAASLQKQLFRASTYAVTGHAPWKGDNFLKVSDRNPNRRGAAAIHDALGLKDVLDGNALLTAVESGKVKALVLIGTELPSADFDRLKAAFSKLDALVVLASEKDAAAQLADVAIPVAAFTEMEGLWVNAFGRVQRVRACVPPKGDAQPAWKALRGLARQLDVNVRQADHRDLVVDLAREVPLFNNLTHESVGAFGVARGAETSAPRKVGEGKLPEDFTLPA
ncbi:MAG: molybdopterin-dependent oxidoreductase [Deltaproteobacteria bacterium]|nr:molybdopterin-dependent oxidoreductase [Deltaproteobacteria bacterium]